MKNFGKAAAAMAMLGIAAAFSAPSGAIGETAASIVEADLPDYPEKITSFGAARLGSAIFVYAGHIGKAHAHTKENLSTGFRKLDLGAGAKEWKVLPAANPSQGLAVVGYKDSIYAIGGMTARNAAGEDSDLRSFAAVTKYSAADGKGEEFTPLPAPRSSHDAVEAEGVIYVVGGWELAGPGDGKWHDTALALDLKAAKPEWKELPKPTFKRRALAAAVAGGKLYAIGGMAEGDTISSEVDFFDFESGEWSKGPALPEKGFGASAIAVGSTIYASGMEGGIYKIEAGGAEWKPLGKFKKPRFFTRLLPLDDSHLVAIAGETRQGHTGDLEIISIASAPEAAAAAQSQTKKVGAASVQVRKIPYPGKAKNRQGVLMNEGRLYVFGGNNSTEQHDFEPVNFVSEGFEIDIESGAVKPAPAFPVARQSMQTIELAGNGAGYAIGGFGHDGKVARSHDEIYRYNFAGGEWKLLGAKLPKPITQFGLAEQGGAVWLFGGMDFDPRRGSRGEFKVQKDVLRWDPKDEAKGFEPAGIEMPNPRRAFGSALVGDKLFLIGGMKEEFQPVEPCDVLDLKTREWAQIAPPPTPLISPQIAALKGKLYLAGGSTFSESAGFKSHTAVLAYDPAADKWNTVIEELPEIPRHTEVRAWNGKLLLYSANDEKGSDATLIEISPEG